ncbi:DNA recombination protein RmuC [Baekduia soli]|uniref:DNA recombination protein RmuC n=1 Tax=Baekduia soli TaxID=496014 RepID=A0A5B8U3J0_9ACTN|nr:DNA recombination protein RmuC [Baekduia soli]QEC47553.1 DNA recombination protein RmuC [Baekduia soli]
MLALAVIVVLILALAGTLHKLASARAAQVRADAALEAERRLHEQAEASHRTRLGELERATAEKVALLQGNREQFRQEMQAISGEVLRGATEQVAELAAQARKADHESANGELRLRAAEITAAVAPIAEHLKDVQTQVRNLERERRATQATVRQMCETTATELGRLRLETGALVSALKRPQVRGSWGEMQLKNVVRVAGMTDHVDFHTQVTVDGDEGTRLHPDMTVHLPTGRDIVVDSKVPLDAYLTALEATGDEERDRHLDRHAAQLRTHLDALATKAYHAKLERSAEFVVCFVPNEACYVAALDRDPGLLERGAGKGVLIATPTTLLALLHATHYGWRQAEVEQSALEIAAAGRELHKRCATFLASFAKVGRQLTSATEAYNASVGSLEGRVLPQLRRLDDLGAASEKELAVPVGIDSVARALTVPEAAGGEITVLGPGEASAA